MKYLNTTTDWMLELINTREAKEKYLVSKENNKYVNQRDLTSKGTDKIDKTIEATKKHKQIYKFTRTKSITIRQGRKKPYMDDTSTKSEMLLYLQ